MNELTTLIELNFKEILICATVLWGTFIFGFTISGME